MKLMTGFKAALMSRYEQINTAQKTMYSIKDFFSKCDQTAVSHGSDHIY